MKHQLRLLFAVCCSIVLLQTNAQLAGSLDPTFANGGIGKYRAGSPLSPSQSEAKKVLLQSDGKIIIAGNCNNSLVEPTSPVKAVSLRLPNL